MILPQDEVQEGCMNGGITTDERCPVPGCGAKFEHIENKGLLCRNHPRVSPTRYRVFFKHKRERVQRRFREYRTAYKFLTGLRARVDHGDFDARDFRRSKPLSFSNLAEYWLELKKADVKKRSWNNLRNYMNRAIEVWGDRNIKEIQYPAIENFLKIYLPQKTDLSEKTIYNIRSCVHEFWDWLGEGTLQPHQIPRIPKLKEPDLGWRTTIAKSVQTQILEEVRRISWHVNPKIWLGIRWLSVYVPLRPDDLLRLTEEDIDLENGCIWLLRPTKNAKPKDIPLLDKDIELVKQIGQDMSPLPHVRFFRHTSGKGIKRGAPFGPKYLWKWWKRACDNLGIEGVDLYGGTRHSSVQALGKIYGPEKLKKDGTIHDTNKAFDRYLRREYEESRKIYQEADLQAERSKANVLPFVKDDSE